jgi:hypothetical protein
MLRLVALVRTTRRNIPEDTILHIFVYVAVTYLLQVSLYQFHFCEFSPLWNMDFDNTDCEK